MKNCSTKLTDWLEDPLFSDLQTDNVKYLCQMVYKIKNDQRSKLKFIENLQVLFEAVLGEEYAMYIFVFIIDVDIFD